MYLKDQNYIVRWIVGLDGYHMINEYRVHDKYQFAGNFKKTEFYERLEEKRDKPVEIKMSSPFRQKK